MSMTIEQAITELAELVCVISTKDEKAKFNIADVINGLTMAIECMEKSIPKKPLQYKEVIGNGYTCSECGWLLGTGQSAIGTKHCYNCGQKIDWSEYD